MPQVARRQGLLLPNTFTPPWTISPKPSEWPQQNENALKPTYMEGCAGFNLGTCVVGFVEHHGVFFREGDGLSRAVVGRVT